MNDTSKLSYTLVSGPSNAIGAPTENGFLVRKDAIARKEVVPSAVSSVRPAQERLLASGVIAEHSGNYIFTRDHEFDSPSGAAGVVLGRTANGWQEWKTEDGLTLSEIKRVKRVVGTAMLTDKKRSEILAKHEELLSKDRLLEHHQIEAFYLAFRRKFSPEVLDSLEGEELLTHMYDLGNRDSMVYWLEFKKDDEFQTKWFGSIAGGSALKFGTFRRKESGIWQAPNEQGKPRDISIEQAIDIANKSREQLIIGYKLLEKLPENATDEEYAQLQDDMDEYAPLVSKLAWGHKYFNLFWTNKLDDYHSEPLQRFHLLKLLQLPPAGRGRYLCAGRFMTAAKEVDLTINQLSTVLNAIQGQMQQYFRIGTKGGSDGTSHWSMMQEQGCIAIGISPLGDVSWVQANKKQRDLLKEELCKIHPDFSNKKIASRCSTFVNFIGKINEGDIVVAADGEKLLGVGRVLGAYSYNPEFDFPHHRPVEWLNLDEWKFPTTEALRSTVSQLKNPENLLAIEELIQQKTVISNKPQVAQPTTRNIRLQGIPKRIQAILERKGQVILYGPPGTGKTYWAENAVMDLVAITGHGKLFNDLDDATKKQLKNPSDTQSTFRVCCFHPAYGYEDFIEGYRPLTTNGQVSFELRDGIFKKLCTDATKNPNKNYYLLVDEINRGDIPRIFGELLMVIEKDKRGKSITLPVSQQPFSVPSNVFMIGTMNTADRSISLLDAALRRRFGFIEMMPDSSVLEGTEVDGIPLDLWLAALNKRIIEHVGRDSRNLQIGHSYLMHSGRPIKDIAALKRAVCDDIIPLLEEYCYEDYQTLEKILGSELILPSDQRIDRTLFDDGQEPNLIQALLNPCPELTTVSSSTDPDNIDDDDDSEDNDDTEFDGNPSSSTD